MINRYRPPFALTTLALGALVGACWTLRALAAPDPPSPSQSHKSASFAVSSPAAAKGDKQPKEAYLTFHGPFRAEGRTNVVTGHDFIYQEEDATITGDNARCQQMGKNPDRYYLLDIDGHLVFDDTTHHATGEKAHVNDQTKVADITGNVVMVLKPEAKTADSGGKAAPSTAADKDPDVNSVKKHGATVKCDHVEDHYKQKYVKLFGHLVFKQRFTDAEGTDVERTLTAEHAEYDGKAETMVLYPPVDEHDNQNNTFHSDNIVRVGTKEGDEWIEGNGTKLVLHPKNEEDESAPAQTADNTNTKSSATSDKKSGTPK